MVQLRRASPRWGDAHYHTRRVCLSASPGAFSEPQFLTINPSTGRCQVLDLRPATCVIVALDLVSRATSSSSFLRNSSL